MDWTLEFRARVQTVRGCGVVHVAERTRADLRRAAVGEIAILGNPRSVADALARSLDFHALGRGWRQLARPDAHAVLAAVLARDLAYDGELMKAKPARLPTSFLVSLTWTPNSLPTAGFAVRRPTRPSRCSVLPSGTRLQKQLSILAW